MDQALIENYCSVVKEGDLVYFLGDHAMGNRENGLEIIRSLPGYKVAIRGNHDYDHSMHKQSIRDKWIPLYKEAFNVVIDQWHPKQTWDDYRIKMSHFPTTFQFAGDKKYEAYRPDLDDCDWLLCGHVHDAFKIQSELKTINVGVDVWGYTPVSQEQLLDLMREHE